MQASRETRRRPTIVLTIRISFLKVVYFTLDPSLSSAEEGWGEFPHHLPTLLDLRYISQPRTLKETEIQQAEGPQIPVCPFEDIWWYRVELHITTPGFQLPSLSLPSSNCRKSRLVGKMFNICSFGSQISKWLNNTGGFTASENRSKLYENPIICQCHFPPTH